MSMTSFQRDILELKEWHDSRRTGRRSSQHPRVVPIPLEPRPERRGRLVAEYIPTPAEIRAACLEIQKEWSEAERRRRAE